MSIRALSWSFNLPLHDMAAKAVLNALAWHVRQEGVCWPSITRIALFAGCDEKTARRGLQRLVSLGIVERDERPGKSARFTLRMAANPSQKQPLPQRPPPTVTPPNKAHTPPNEARDPSQRDPDPSHGGSRIIKNLKESSERPPAAAGDPGGPPRPALTSVDKWAERLANHRPQNGKPCWTNAWGPQPDSAGHNPLIPPALYREWRAQYDRDMAALKGQGAAA